MSILINSQNSSSYIRSMFEHPSKWYDSYQENGTKYLKSRKPLEEQLKQQLNACAGEIYISGIPPETRAEEIAEIAALVGEVYILRFKVEFSGNSRGFAYLQYMNPNLKPVALMRLPSLFRNHLFPTVRVRESRNSSKLLLKKIYRMDPKLVFENLTKLVNFQKLVGHEIFPGQFEYQIVFKSNEEAVHARRELLRSISTFGRNALLVWDHNKNNNEHSNNHENNSRVQIKHNGNQSLNMASIAAVNKTTGVQFNHNVNSAALSHGIVNYTNTSLVNTTNLTALTLLRKISNENPLNALNMNIF